LKVRLLAEDCHTKTRQQLFDISEDGWDFGKKNSPANLKIDSLFIIIFLISS
jgi:hypothetical protein